MQKIPLQFPIKGVSEVPPFGAALNSIAPDALNVRPFDVTEGRVRGGQRPGSERYIATPVDGSNPIQRITKGVVASSFGPVLSDPFTYANGNLPTVSGSLWSTFNIASWTTLLTTKPVVTSNAVGVASATSGNTFISYRTDYTAPPKNYRVQAEITFNPAATAQHPGVVAFQYPGAFSYGATLSYSGAYTITLKSFQASGGIVNTISSAVLPAAWVSPFLVQIDVQATNEGFSRGNITVRVNGVTFLTLSNVALYGSGVPVANPGYPGITWVDRNPADSTLRFDNFAVLSADEHPRGLKSTLVVVANGSIYQSDSPPTTLTAATGGSTALSVTPRLAAVLGPPSPQDAAPASGHSHIYYADGFSYKKLDLVTNVASDWTAASPGTMPTGCRIAALFRGRIVLSGSEDDPQNWFMSAVEDPRNWDYGASPVTARIAIAGNNSDAGKMDDIITCLASFGDDVLVMGGDHTIEVMSGDPADGGRRDNLSKDIGIVGPDAWTIDPYGNMYIFATNGLNRLTKAGQLDLVSGGRLDKTFSNVDLSSVRVLLAWDRDRQGCHIFFPPLAQGAAPIAYWYDLRTDAFWPQQWPAETGPTAVCVFDGDAPSDRALVFGGFDSVIRRESDQVKNDDTSDAQAPDPINSFLDLGLIVPTGVMQQAVAQDWQLILGSESGSVTASVFAASSPEKAKKATTPRYVRVLKGGRNIHTRQPVAGNAFRFRLANNILNETWSMESGELILADAGRVQGGQS